MSETAPTKVYVQGDWIVSTVAGDTDEAIKQRYDTLLTALAARQITNVATWHIDGVGVGAQEPGTDVLRNFAQIDAADAVVTFLQRDDPPKRHWGSIALIAYALARGKRVIVGAGADNVCWKHHAMHHPAIDVVSSSDVDDIPAQLAAAV